MGRLLIVAGVFLLVLGLLLSLGPNIPYLGKLPGDITIKGNGFRLFFPIASSIIVSLVLSIVINLIIRLWK